MHHPESAMPREYYDVFISYRHRDAKAALSLEQKIEAYRYRPFRDENFPELRDTCDVTREKISVIRGHLARSTCLIFAYSRKSMASAEEHADPVGAWMPWELGFFDGSVSGRIGIYLLDGEPEGFNSLEFDAKSYFKGNEYLQIYECLTDSNLQTFLARNAGRERRIDNVESAFAWMANLAEESLLNPCNVGLGVAEWHVDHMANYWRSVGLNDWAIMFDAAKLQLDDLRMGWTPKLRSDLGEAMLNYFKISASSSAGRRGEDGGGATIGVGQWGGTSFITSKILP